MFVQSRDSRTGTDGLSRREMMKLATLGVSATSACGWMDVLAAEAARQTGREKKACIVLWMAGGPSHLDTFDPKPESPDAGEFKPISTSVPGVHISDQLPLLAKQMKHMALIRGMATGEGSHARGTYLMHTGYRSGQPFAYPGIGSIVSREIGDSRAEMPNFVSIGNVRAGQGPGYLGPQHAPLVVQPGKGIDNLKSPVTDETFDRRVHLLDFLESRFRRSHRVPDPILGHETVYRKAMRLMRGKASRAFDVSDESAKVLELYGDDRFARSCLVARRLVETGVSFVEVPLGGWDTHGQNFDKLRKLLPQVDQAMSALIRDLEGRGLLDSTLVIWMGEFGRTPKINKKKGRDHYAKAWSTVVAGGGIPGGQVIGKTDKLGARVDERPVQARDFLATVCKILDVDYTKTYTSKQGRPIRVVEEGEKPITELFPGTRREPAAGRRRKLRSIEI